MKNHSWILPLAVLTVVLAARPATRAWAQDEDQGDDCGATGSIVDDDNQGDDDAQGDENGCGVVAGEVDDENGDQVDDTNDDGTENDDVDIDVEETLSDGNVDVMAFHSNGGFDLSGLPSGRVK